jgi:hypothetical protein
MGVYEKIRISFLAGKKGGKIQNQNDHVTASILAGKKGGKFPSKMMTSPPAENVVSNTRYIYLYNHGMF